MAEFLALQCLNCRAEFAVPDVYKPHLQGRAVHCPACRKSWVAFPSEVETETIEACRVDLRKFRRSTPVAKPQSTPAMAPPEAGSGQPSVASAQAAARSPGNEVNQGLTTQIPINGAVPEQLSLRIVVSGPDGNITGVFALADKTFWIGRKNCHLRLPEAPIPDRAIEVRRIEDGFKIVGRNGFALQLGALSAPSALTTPGQSVTLTLTPYSLELQTSTTPGSPVKDLPSSPSPAGPGPAVARAPAVASVQPSPALQSSPPQNARQQIQELAVEVSPHQGIFGDPSGPGDISVLDEVDGDMTITDMGAIGIHAQRAGGDVFRQLEISLERADGAQRGLKFQITKTPLLIGRSELGLTIKDQRVSSKHAQLDVNGPRVYTLKDLASTNGTTVNGRPISVAHLADGDLISFGGVTFKFHADKKQT